MARYLDWINERLPLSEFLERHVTGYPTPRDLSYLWNFGSVLGVFFAIQVLTGVWLAMYYKPDAALAFGSVQHIMRDVNYGWLIRGLHATGATGLFFALYVHMGRGIYYGSYKRPRELLWWIGLALFLGFMAEAFMGYLLPWGQMSFWGATVITNLFTAVPVVGQGLTVWLRGDFAVGDATLTRFYSLHTTLVPFAILAALIVVHLSALHKVGSGNPDGSDLDKKGPAMLPFSPYYITKDAWFISLALTIYLSFVFFWPDAFMEPVNSEPADPLKTPLHIVPEWYFLPFYAILRSIPDKLGGVVAMGGSIFMLALLPLLDRSEVRSARHRPLKRALTWALFVDFALLGYVGMNPPDAVSPVGLRMATLGMLFTALYFLYFALLPVLPYLEKGSGKKGAGAALLAAALLAAPGSALAAGGFEVDSGAEAYARGKALYEQHCLACHGLRHYRGPDEPSGMAALMDEEAAEQAFGAPPPDLSLMAAARGKGTQGAGYIHRLLTTYFIEDGLTKNRAFAEQTHSDGVIAMPPPIPMDDPGLDEKARDIAAFLYHVSDPTRQERLGLGPWVAGFMALLTAVLYLLNRQVWKAVKARPPEV